MDRIAFARELLAVAKELTAEDLDALDTIYERLLRAGVELDHHESDLYAKKTPESDRIVQSYRYKSNVTVFRSTFDGSPWYDIPFAYTPWWDKAVSSLSGGRIKTIAREMLAMDFPTQEALDKYLKDHPDADRGKHHVRETKKESPTKQEAPTKKRSKEEIEKLHEGMLDKNKAISSVLRKPYFSTMPADMKSGDVPKSKTWLVGELKNEFDDFVVEQVYRGRKRNPKAFPGDDDMPSDTWYNRVRNEWANEAAEIILKKAR